MRQVGPLSDSGLVGFGSATEEMLSVTALRRLVANRSGRGRRVTGRPLYSPSRAMAK